MSAESSPLPLSAVRSPRHVAIIMDGNGRWAAERGWHRSMGHMRGSSIVKDIIKEADAIGIEVLTLYCFSTENWNRPEDEIEALMQLLREFLLKERMELMQNNIRLQALGETERIPEVIKQILDESIELTQQNTGMILNFCISYGARSEILRATRSLCQKVQSGELSADSIDEESFSKELYTRDLPDPDLLIRTSGENRISNFLLWQIAYSELYVTKIHWPDFTPNDLREACNEFSHRQRRYGRSDETKSAEP